VPDLKVHIGELTLKNPVTVASGTFGYGREYQSFYDPSLLGAIFLKSVTLEERLGNPPPRLVETPAGLINSIGLQNVGLDRFLDEVLPGLEGIDTLLVANIAGDTVDEYVQLADALSDCTRLAALEVNVSCPNVEEGGMAFGTSADMVREVTREVVAASALPVIVKLTPNVTDIESMARAAEEAGATALSLVNTFLAMAIDVELRRPILGNGTGGLSGPAIKPIALRMVWQVARSVSIPIIGMGGIMTGKDAIEFLMAGATAIAVGTANFVNPLAPVEIIKELEMFLETHHYTSVREIINVVEG
jgi:dihydroorotate dehydrogenase (NAD+) catalytic subunit